MLKIKKIFGITMSVLLILSAVPVFSFAENTYYTSEDGYLTYKIENGEAIIIGCDTSISGDYTIPSTLGGYPVTKIGNDAFSNCESLTSVTIGDSVTEIGESAFFNCELLKSITIPAGVTSIGYRSIGWVYVPADIEGYGGYTYIAYTIYGYEGTAAETYANENGGTFVAINESTEQVSQDGYLNYEIENGEATIIGCDTSISGAYTIPDTLGGYSVTAIGGEAFRECTFLENIVIPDSVTAIGYCAFHNCKSLESVNIPDSVTLIGVGAFAACVSLENITISDSVAYIGSDAFGNTAYYNNNSNWEDGVLYIGNHLIEADPDIISGSYEIKEGTKTIAGGAFGGCESLASITIPDSVVSFGDYAFSACTSLESVIIPDSVTKIGEFAFYDCTALTSVTIPYSVTSIGGCAFGYTYNSVDVLVDGFTIYGYDNTAAEEYANEKGITFISLGEYTETEETTTEISTVEESVSEEPSSQAAGDNGSSGSLVYVLIAAIIGMLVIAAVIVVIVLVVTKNNRKKTPQPPKYNGTYN